MAEIVNPVEHARRRASAAGRLRTLVNTSFSAAGIRWPEERYEAAWTVWRNDPSYTPTGRGGITARTALAQEISAAGIPCAPEDLLLAAGSSLSYHLLFSVLRHRAPRRDPARTVALPTPGYPLFEGILAPLGMSPVWYRCPPEDGFLPDYAEIQRLVTHPNPPAAVVLISPNNPAGVVYPDEAVSAIGELCAAAGVTLILDEVFSLFRDAPTGSSSPTGSNPTTGSDTRTNSDTPTGSDLVAHDTTESPVPVVHLNGVSKVCAAPEIKLGWIMLSGGDSTVRTGLMEALDTEHDTYLALSGFAEAAVAPFLRDEAAGTARRAIRNRVSRMRSEMLTEIESSSGWHAAAVNGGIHIPLQLDPMAASERFGTLDDETIAVEILERTGVYLHPGYFYGLDYPQFSGGPWFVVSALIEESSRREAFRRLRQLL